MGKNSKPQTTTTRQEPWEGAKPYWLKMYGDIFGTPLYQALWPRTPSSSINRYSPIIGGTSLINTMVPSLARIGAGPAGVNLSTALIRAGYPNYANSVSQGRYGEEGLLGRTKYIEDTPNMLDAYSMVENRARKPSQMLQGAEDYATRVLSGEFLDPSKNLAMARSLQRGMEDLGAWDTSAVQAGRYGSGAWGAGRGRQLADLQGNLYGQGLQQMTQMASMTPSIYESGYLPAQKLLALGEQQRQMQQEKQMFPWELMGMAANLLSGSGGGSTSSPYFKPNPLLGALGGGLAAAPFAAAVPWAVPVAAGVGYLGSK